MNCIYCGNELLEGRIQLYEFGSVILKMPATLKFVPKDKNEKTKKLINWMILHMVFIARNVTGFLLILLPKKGYSKVKR